MCANLTNYLLEGTESPPTMHVRGRAHRQLHNLLPLKEKLKKSNINILIMRKHLLITTNYYLMK